MSPGLDSEAGGAPGWGTPKLGVGAGDDGAAPAAGAPGVPASPSLAGWPGSVTGADKQLSLLLPGTCPASSGETPVKSQPAARKADSDRGTSRMTQKLSSPCPCERKSRF